MGVHVRYVNIEGIKKHLQQNKSLNSLFCVECLVCADTESRKVKTYYHHGFSEEEIKQKIGGIDE